MFAKLTSNPTYGTQPLISGNCFVGRISRVSSARRNTARSAPCSVFIRHHRRVTIFSQLISTPAYGTQPLVSGNCFVGRISREYSERRNPTGRSIGSIYIIVIVGL